MSAALFTGERPGRGADFAYDTARAMAAYRCACELARGLSVLDAGCGEGAGSDALATVARAVLGADYSAEAIAACRARWQRPNLRFVQLDLMDLGLLEERFELIVNFQVLEHLREPRPFVAALRDRLVPGGRLLLTTPNRLMSFSENPFHVHEYTAAELHALLAEAFPSVAVRGMHGNAAVQAFDAARAAAVRRILRLDPLGLRRRLPAWLVTRAFARLARLVRRRVQTAGAGGAITVQDFYVADDRADDAIDLVALCAT